MIATFLSLILATSSAAECQADRTLTEELTKLGNSDQAARTEMWKKKIQYGTPEWKVFWEKLEPEDRKRMSRLADIFDSRGWPGYCLVGEKGSMSAFFILQHSDIGTQKKYLPLLEKAVKEGQAKPSTLAYLIDRIRMNDGLPQVYGSQTRMNETTKKYELYQVEDIEHVDQRRAKMGLGTLRDYIVNDMGLEYPEPKKSQ